MIKLGKAKITVTGVANKPPKIKDDKTVDLVLKVDSSPVVPKGLKPLGQSICLVHIAPKTWKKVAENVKEDSFYIIQGDVKAKVNSKNIPFLEIVAFDISLKPDAVAKEQLKKKVPEEVVEKQQKETPKQIKSPVKEEDLKQKEKIKGNLNSQKVQPTKKQPKKKEQENQENQTVFSKWYDPEEIQYVSHKDIIMTEDIHLRTKELRLNGVFKSVYERKTLKSPIAVRPLGEKYVLIIGIKQYITAKILDMENVPVVIKDMTHSEFMKKYRIK